MQNAKCKMQNAECRDSTTDFKEMQNEHNAESRNQSEHGDGQWRISKAGETSGE
jgi:hypothetical protein